MIARIAASLLFAAALLVSLVAVASTSSPKLFELQAETVPSLCISAPTSGAGVSTTLTLAPCGASGWNQLWYLPEQGAAPAGDELALSGTALCVDVGPSAWNGVRPFLNACQNTAGQLWKRTPANGSAAPPLIWSVLGGFCMTAPSTNIGTPVTVTACTTLPTQQWIGGP